MTGSFSRGVLLMDELSISLSDRLFAIIVRATGAQSAHGLFLRPGMFPEDRCQGTHLEPLMAWHDVRGTHGIAVADRECMDEGQVLDYPEGLRFCRHMLRNPPRVYHGLA